MENNNNNKSRKIPSTTVARLPIYLRCLQMMQERSIGSISSFQLAELTGHNPAQLRKDLSYLGEFGTRGVGYDVESLIRHIGKWLGATSVRSVVVIGAGHLGQALCNYQGFKDKGFSVVALYDTDKKKIGDEVGGLRIKHIKELQINGATPIDVGIIATPAENAQDVADHLIAAGVKSILNFAPVKLDIGSGICVRNVDLSTELQIMGFHLASVEHGLSSDCCS